MSFFKDLRYRLRMLTSTEIAVTAMVLLGWVRMAAKDRLVGPRRSIRWRRFVTSRRTASQ